VPGTTAEKPKDAAEFFGAPYDGLVLKIEQIHSWCRLIKAERGDEERLFALMPSPIDWSRVVDGKLPKDGPFDMVYVYEILRREREVAFVLRSHVEFAYFRNERSAARRAFRVAMELPRPRSRWSRNAKTVGEHRG
jgi:hypothetical protein